MRYLENILFAVILIIGFGYFIKKIKKIIRNIRLGKKVDCENSRHERVKNLLKFTFGQSKMIKKPVVTFFHSIIFLAFIFINIELIEILIDGLFGTHRFFASIGRFYNVLIGTLEILALLVILAVSVFYIRRNVLKLGRFIHSDLNGWDKKDANYILIFELIIMLLFLFINAADFHLQIFLQKYNTFNKVHFFTVSQYIEPVFNNISIFSVFILYRIFWWLHIVGIIFFLNYLYYSKHLHIILAFPNIYYSNSDNIGKLNNIQSITREAKLILEQKIDGNSINNEIQMPDSFGAKDIKDLSRIQLLNAYSCTECGRCTSSCPANLTGKKLSPRKIMMSVRDRMEEVGRNIDKNKGVFVDNNKHLLYNYISSEEIWACTFCNACVEECPIHINPVSIILDLKRYLVMEKGEVPITINSMMTNIENNGSPWQ